MKKLIKIGGWILVSVAALAVIAYTQIFGFTVARRIEDRVYFVYNSGGLSRIGANVIAIDAGTSWVVFDTHLGPLAGAAIRKIKSINKAPIVLAFNSHWHPDHSGGNAAFTGEAEIIAHSNVRRTLSRAHEGVGLTKPGSYKMYDPVGTEGLPETLIENNKVFRAENIEMEAVHYPSAHTDGDIVLFVPSLKIVAIGDLIWPQGFPFVDVSSGGSARGVSRALKDILERAGDDYLYLMGHGDPFSAEQVRNYIVMIDATVDFVEAKKSAGESLDSIEADGLPEIWRSWETKLNPQEEWIRMIYESL